MSTRRKKAIAAKRRSNMNTGNHKQESRDQAGNVTLVCRVCMRWSARFHMMVDLLDRQVQGIVLAKVLAQMGGVDVATVDDRLPKWCCKRCLKELESAYKLRLRCQDSDRKLREMQSDVDAVVVKQEFDEDEMNPLEEELVVECKLELNEMLLDVSAESISEAITVPKLEVSADGNVEKHQQTNEVEDFDVPDDFACVDSKSDVEDEMKTEVKANEQTKGRHLIPDVFEEVPAVDVRCCGCRKFFTTMEDLRAHSQLAHSGKKLSVEQLNKRVQCDICFKVVNRPKALEQHQQKYTLNFRCKTCGEIFLTRVMASQHYKRIHGSNPSVSGLSKFCCGCSEKFETCEQLKEHSLAVHLPEKPAPDPNRPFICNVCYRNYKTRTHMYNHQIRLLKKTKKYMCEECGMLFLYPSMLRDHEVTHTGEKAFRCPHCPKAYSSKASYRKHVQGHKMPPDRYKCEICEVCYRTSIGLKEHRLKHTGERPYKCPHCPATYARPSGLTAHLPTHSVHRSKECPLCGKGFKRSCEVRYHVKFFHQKQKPFPCFFCPKQYPRKDYRKRHMVSAHAEELRNNPLPPIELYGCPQWRGQKGNEAAQEGAER